MDKLIYLCITNSLKIVEFVEEKNESGVYGEDNKWELIFHK